MHIFFLHYKSSHVGTKIIYFKLIFICHIVNIFLMFGINSYYNLFLKLISRTKYLRIMAP